MSRIFTFVFILFVTLSIVNAAPYHLDKRKTKFQRCLGLLPSVVPLNVTMSPDPIVPGKKVTFDISGTLKHDINSGDGAFVAIDLVDKKKPLGKPHIVDICTDAKANVKCPIKAGTQYTTTQEITAPPDLPLTYGIVVGIGAGKPPKVVPYACELAIVGPLPPLSNNFTSVIF